MHKIEIGKGLGPVRFGMQRKDLIAVAGEPDEREEVSYSEEGDENSESWHYDQDEFSVSFDQIDDWLLGTIATSSSEVSLKGHQLIGLTKQQILELIDALELGEAEEEDFMAEGEKDTVIAVEQSAIYFWLQDGEVSEVQFGPVLED